MYKDPATFIAEATNSVVSNLQSYQKIMSQIYSVHSEFVSNSLETQAGLAKTILKTFTK